MIEIPNSLHSLFTATVKQHDGTSVIEVPSAEVTRGASSPSEAVNLLVQRVVEAIMTGLLRRGLSPGQAWAYYGVEICGYSRNQWAKRCGYSDHSAVSEPLRKAKKKLPA